MHVTRFSSKLLYTAAFCDLFENLIPCALSGWMDQWWPSLEINPFVGLVS